MNSKYFILIFLSLIFFIILKGYIFSHKYSTDEYAKEYIVYIISKVKETDTMVSYNVKLNKGEAFRDKFILNICKSSFGEEKEKIDITKYINLSHGETFKVKGKIVIPEYRKNPGEFNYKLYLYSNNIHGTIVTYTDLITVCHKYTFSENITRSIYKYKQEIEDKIESRLDNKTASVAKGLIYGETVDLDGGIKQSFEQVGVSHLMAISGSNISSLVSVISIILILIKLKGKYKNVIAVVIVVFYVILTGASMSCIRAGIMSIIALITKRKTKTKSLLSMLIALLLIMVYAPFSIFNVGCILSFLATLGIILFVDILKEVSDKFINKVKSKVLKKILELLLNSLQITLAVQILVLPIQINTFNVISSSLLISNLLTSFLIIPITFLSSLFVLFVKIPYVSDVIIYAISIFVKILIFVIQMLKNISVDISVQEQPIYILVIYYLMVFGIVIKNNLYKLFLKHNDIKDIKINVSWKKINKIQVVSIVISLFLVITYNIWTIYYSSFVYYFNVDQGEMSYIKCGKESVIVDIGSTNNTLAFNTIDTYFTKQNISKVDAVIISHMHTDHVNGLEKFLEKYDVEQIIYPKIHFKNDVCDRFIQITNMYKIKLREVQRGDKIQIGNITIEVLFPFDKVIGSKEDLNANSLVCKITVKDKTLLYMGDATVGSEQAILKEYTNILKDIDILKVGHHGSKTATCEQFIHGITPRFGVISAKKKYYGHPHEMVLEVLKKYNVHIYITEKYGAIKFNMYNL